MRVTCYLALWILGVKENDTLKWRKKEGKKGRERVKERRKEEVFAMLGTYVNFLAYSLFTDTLKKRKTEEKKERKRVKERRKGEIFFQCWVLVVILFLLLPSFLIH